MTVSFGNPRSSEPPPEDRKKRRSFFGKIFRGTGWLAAGPVDWAGTRRIRRGWSFIGDSIRSRPPSIKPRCPASVTRLPGPERLHGEVGLQTRLKIAAPPTNNAVTCQIRTLLDQRVERHELRRRQLRRAPWAASVG
jgi:hypothetical protein